VGGNWELLPALTGATIRDAVNRGKVYVAERSGEIIGAISWLGPGRKDMTP